MHVIKTLNQKVDQSHWKGFKNVFAMTFTINASLQNKRLHKLICTFLLSRNYFNMGIREEEVEVDWDVRSKIFQDCFLLTEIMQTYFYYCFQFQISSTYLICTFQGGFSFQLCTGCTEVFLDAYIWECAELQSSTVGKYNHWLSLVL